MNNPMKAQKKKMILFLLLFCTACQASAQDGGIIVAIVGGFCLLFGALYISGWIK